MADPAAASPASLFACMYWPPSAGTMGHAGADSRDAGALRAIAQDFSPRFEIDRDDLVSIDVSGLGRLLGTPQAIGEELRRAAADRGLRVHVGVARTRTAALVAAEARPGLTIIGPGEEAAALASVSIDILAKTPAATPALSVFRGWGLRTLGDLAALPAAELASRLGRPALVWQAVARGEEIRPLIPALDDERFDGALELEWPIEGMEPLSFVLTRLLEPLSTRLERRDRGAAVLHVLLRLVTREIHARRLELPAPMRDVRTLRTLALLDLESHPPAAAIDGVTIVIDPTPGRVLQHTLFTRPHPTPEQLSTLMARLAAVMGQDRVGAPATVDSYRPGAFAIKTFQPERESLRSGARDSDAASARGGGAPRALINACGHISIHPDALTSALRRCRHPVPARVVVEDERPVRVTTDRRGFAGGAVVHAAGPWRVSGEWWSEAPREAPAAMPAAASAKRVAGAMASASAPRDSKNSPPAFNRDEWDVALGDGAVYVVYRDRETNRWFVDAIVD